MFDIIKSSLSNSSNRHFLNSLLLVFLIYFIYSYFLKLNYILDSRDEIYFLFSGVRNVFIFRRHSNNINFHGDLFSSDNAKRYCVLVL